MANPFAPLIGFLGMSVLGRRSKKRRRKRKSSEGNGAPTQRSSSRALDIIRIQRGLPRNGHDPSSQTADEVAATERSIPDGVPPLRIAKMIGTDTIGLTTDGKRGYVGPQWWSREGRNLLSQIRRRHPGATPEEALLLLLKQAVPSVEWESDDLPRGAHVLARRLRRLVEAAYMGREVEARPLVAEADEPPESPAEAPPGMPFSSFPDELEGPVVPSVPPEVEMGDEAAVAGAESADLGEASASEPSESEAAQEAQESPGRGKIRRGGRGRGRRGGKKDRKAAAEQAAAEQAAAEQADVAVSAAQEGAHDTPEGDGGGTSEGDGSGDGSGSSESSGSSGDGSPNNRSDAPEADASPSEQ